MSDYLVLARKYRSATFEDVVGQEHVAKTLVNAIKAGRIAHAFLFAGTRGVGKTTVARILSKALNCLSADEPTPTPCNRCNACEAISRGEDVDVIEIDGASNRGIEQIRDLRNNAIYRPARTRYKVYYIDEVHMLTREAFNALLKTLEEPPAHVKFIFATTEPEKLPATVISRCQRFDFRNIPTAQIAEHLQSICKLEKAKADAAAVFRIARAAAGSMRDGLSLLDQLLSAGGGNVSEEDVVAVLGTPADERTGAIVSAIADGDPASALNELDGMIEGGITLESAIAAVGEMFRNIMLASACGPQSELIELPEGPRETVAQLAERFTLPALVGAVSVCQTTGRSLRGLTAGRGLVEAALVRLAAADKFVDAASLIERLESLSAGAPAGRRPAQPAQPAGTGQKKKPVAAPPGAEQSPPPAAKLIDPRWEMAYIAEHWSGLMAALAGDRKGQVSGLLAPAKVLALADSTLRLGYDKAHEAVRRRCESMAEQIDQALGSLFGRSVRCEYVATGLEGESTSKPSGPPRLSTAERSAINRDPAVQAVLNYFDGNIEYIRQVEPPAGGQTADGE